MESIKWLRYVLGAGILGWVVYVVSRAQGEIRAPQLPQDTPSYDGAMDSMGGFTVQLTDLQKDMAALIQAQAQTALLDPSFMIALAVTESSLDPSKIGDDGLSYGLFQINRRYIAAIPEKLLDPEFNTEAAMKKMGLLIRSFPGYTYGDYAEAWTLGATGRFKRGRRNPQKVQHMAQAVIDLGLTLNLNEVPT